MKDSTTIVTITAKGQRGSGKTTLIGVIKKALEAAGYPVSAVSVFGDENKEEMIFVTTQRTRAEWTTKLPK